MHNRMAFSTFLILGMMASNGLAQQWADLKFRLVYDGKEVPARKPIDMTRDPVCAALPPSMEESLVVHPENFGIANAFVWLDAKKSNLGKSDIHSDMKPRAEPVLLDNKGCVFVPHALVMQAGETINVKNSDQTGHNANFNFIQGAGVNMLIPPGGAKTLELLVAEPAPIPVQCNVHPWMEAKLMVLDHPYGTVSGADGSVTMKNLPAKNITLRIIHERSAKSLDEVTIAGKKVEWKKGFFEIELKPGMNDLGDVKIAASKFK